jgi:hypothetical protein
VINEMSERRDTTASMETVAAAISDWRNSYAGPLMTGPGQPRGTAAAVRRQRRTSAGKSPTTGSGSGAQQKRKAASKAGKHGR